VVTFAFGAESEAALATCDPRLVAVFREVIKHYDCKVLCGYRNQADQAKAIADGTSKTPWPKSKHNTLPSLAVDVVPYPIDWNNRERFALFAGFVLGIAAGMGIKLRSGADWNSNGNTKDDGWDMPHFEIVEG
jgi:peptidoglycan L-alanyl-D-glutamate endopeptidase CwlK